MEEPKKRKLDINWDKLIPRNTKSDDDDELVPELEIRPVECFKNLSDKALLDKISRMKRISRMSTLTLSDGGEKLQATLKLLEAEVECRSKIPKTFKDATPMAKKTGYAGSTDSRAKSAPAGQSEFGSSLNRRLDDNGAHKKTGAFEQEIFAINRCKQNKRVNPPFSSKSDPKTRVCSISAFKSPRLTFKNTDRSQLSNGRQSRSQCYDPVPFRTSRDSSPVRICRDPSPVYQKSSAPHFQASRGSSQNNRKTFVHLKEDFESEAIDSVEKLDESMKGTLISYPRDAPDAIDINYSDVECLDPERYLTSTIMNFYILYLQKPTSPTAAKRRDYHFLNTYFYKKLSQDVLKKSDRDSSFPKLRRWWKGVNIFEKAYIFLPVHESLHWSLVIICIPDKKDESGPIVLHLDSLGMHNSKSICRDVKSFLMEEWKFLRRGDSVPELPIAEKVWENLSENIDDRVIEVPQQGNEFDCGIFVLYFMERFIDEAPERLTRKDLVKFGKQWFKPGDASSLRQRIRKLLIQEFKNATKVSIDLDP